MTQSVAEEICCDQSVYPSKRLLLKMSCVYNSVVYKHLSVSASLGFYFDYRLPLYLTHMNLKT